MENYVSYNTRRKNTPKSAPLRAKNVKSLKLNEYDVLKPLRRDFDTIELELENTNLRKMVNILEGKNKVLEEHCSFLKEKNNYFQTRLHDLEQNKSEKEESEEQNEEIHDQNNTTLKDRISGVLFGVALPKFGEVLAKIRAKRHEIKSLVEETGDGPRECPMNNPDFKTNLQVIKLNLVRVAIVLGSLILVSGVGYAGYRIWKTRYRHPSYLIPSDDDEDSAEELFSAPGASRNADSIVKSNSTDSFETPGISTDFRSILDRTNNK